MSRIADTLAAPQIARARMRAGSGFEAEASVTVSPLGLLAIGGLMAAILLSTASIVRAERRRSLRARRPQQSALPHRAVPILLPPDPARP